MSEQPVMDVAKNADLSRYEARIGGVVAGFSAYRVEGNRVVFTHSLVGDEWAGNGVGSAVARFALDDVVASGQEITPICPFITAYIRKHPEYVPSVDAAHRYQFE
jgi:predicted GNAT family acetyltransferase